MATECTNIRFFKVTTLPTTGVPDSIYLLLEGGFVRQYVTDSQGNLLSAPGVLETLTQLRRSGSSIIYRDESNVEINIAFSSVAFSGLYSELIGSPTNTSSFTNDGDGTSPFATLDDIPTDVGDLTLNFDIGSSIRFSPGDPFTLELVDRNNVVISSVMLTPANIAGLSSYIGFDSRYYTKASINDFFAGNTPINGYNKSQWDEAYSWGDHSLAGYLTSFTETDPVFTASAAASITTSQIANWNVAYSWGDHRAAGYLTQFIETDPLFRASAAFGIDILMIANWEEAYSWGDHALAGYLTSFTETDPLFSSSPASGISGIQIANWDIAFGWGDHAGLYVDLVSNQTIGGDKTFTGAVQAPSVQLTGGVGTQGTLSWNPDEETLDLIQDGAILQIGQEIHYHARNNTGSAIADGTAVMATGTLGNSGRITIAPMLNDGTLEPEVFMGIATEVIEAGEDGKVTHFGKIRGIQTDGANYGETWNDGDFLYLSKTTPGNLTKVKPEAYAHRSPIAIVINAHGNNGAIFVRAHINEGLHELHDVQLTNLADQDLLKWNAAAGRWENYVGGNWVLLDTPNTGSIEVTGTITAAEVFVDDEPYSSAWNNSLEVPTKNAVYDRVEQIVAGGADKTFTFVQGLPSNTWNVNHNLNKYPSVTVIDSANTVVIGNVEYTDPNNLIITFSGAFSGRAELN
jgi:hypothetical protein